ncbi:hypothetical protein [Ruegeria sp. HKCCD7255]|uniref:hypothetical protein n=1 Tax=Ruegeria sp. HKCCD7255 TaxID=2683004 RepID=UPI0020C257E5|nr:hypothetical protein [Ruegeria sp. HKCCD7255]
MNRVLLTAAGVLLPLSAFAEPSVERGEYLVRGPAACGNCHTPQGPNGPDMSNELTAMRTKLPFLQSGVCATVEARGAIYGIDRGALGLCGRLLARFDPSFFDQTNKNTRRTASAG